MQNLNNFNNLSKTKAKNKQIILNTLEKMIKENQEITIKTLAARSGFSIGIIYQYEDIRNKVTAQRFLNSKRNKKMMEQRRLYKRRLVYEAICKLESMNLEMSFENVSKYSGVSMNFLRSQDDIKHNIEYLMKRKRESQNTKSISSNKEIHLFNKAIDTMLSENKKVNFRTVSKHLNIDVKELYKYDEIRERIIKIRVDNMGNRKTSMGTTRINNKRA